MSDDCDEAVYSVAGKVDVLIRRPLKSPKKAVISFTSMNPGKFERYTWLTQDAVGCDTLVILLKDEPQHFYLGPKSEPIEEELMGELRGKLMSFDVDPRHVITVGSSMGGYAAISYGAGLGVGRIISINPQVDRVSAGHHKYELWTRKITESAWVDLNVKLKTYTLDQTSMLIIHGQYCADLSAVKKLEKVIKDIGCSYKLESLEKSDHGWMDMSRDRLIRISNAGAGFPE